MTPYRGRHRRLQTDDERAAEARAAGLCSSCEGSRTGLFGSLCRTCNGIGTAQAETNTVLDGILAELEANDAR